MGRGGQGLHEPLQQMALGIVPVAVSVVFLLSMIAEADAPFIAVPPLDPPPTERLRLRRWRPDDLDPFAAMNADPMVMEHFLAPLSREESAAFITRIEAHFAANGFGLWAVEIPGGEPFIGFVGLSVPRFQAPFTPCVEIGWRLASPFWGRGYATEAAMAVMEFGFGPLGLEEIVSFTAPRNQRSRRVMEKLGLRRDPSEDFDHPSVPEGHPLRRHVLYRMSRDSWRDRLCVAP